MMAAQAAPAITRHDRPQGLPGSTVVGPGLRGALTTGGLVALDVQPAPP